MSAVPRRSTEFDLIVVGAGLAGSTVAAAVADAGHRVLLLERTRFPRHKVCGEFLSPEVQATLRTLGIRRGGGVRTRSR
ncbi:MAG: tryptophan 7-halogenase [Caldilineaceae bacterium]